MSNFQSGDTIRHKQEGTEVVVLDYDQTTFDENGYEVKTLEDGVHRFLPRAQFDQWEVVDGDSCGA